MRLCMEDLTAVLVIFSLNSRLGTTLGRETYGFCWRCYWPKGWRDSGDSRAKVVAKAISDGVYGH